ncbi:MAG: hypothetical protein PHQ72_06125 [Hespellia sp.]|nr:hypothetical protein [Hespellia sp.]
MKQHPLHTTSKICHREEKELNQKKMIVLIPFQLLKLRNLIQKKPTKENFALLQNLILNDIIGSIKANLTVGNITKRDADELISLTLQLYEHIYQHKEAKEKAEQYSRANETLSAENERLKKELAKLLK